MSFHLTPFGSVPFGASAPEAQPELLEDTLVSSDELLFFDIPSLTESVATAADLIVNHSMNIGVSDEHEMDDALRIILSFLTSSEAATSTTLTAVLTQLDHLVETLVLTGSVTTRIESMAAIAEALVVEDLVRFGWDADAASSANAQDAITARLRMIVNALSTSATGASAVPTLQVSAIVEDGVDFEAIATTSTQFFMALADGLRMSFVLRIGDADFTAWVLSVNKRAADGSMIPAVVEYRNFPFNSFASFNGKYYGASEHGLFELTGETDNGDEIAAWVRSALANFGVMQLKKMPSVYLGYTSDGTMVLKVITTKQGSKVEDWYALRSRPATAMRDGRVKVGEGLSSVYWAWELHNKDGADFALDTVELVPVILERRIRDGR